MKILMTADAVGGVWTYALELARALRAFDTEVCIATMGPRPDLDQVAAAAALDNVTLFSGDYRLEWMEDPWRDVEAAGEWLLELEQQCTPDIVQINGYAHAALPFSAPIVLVAHSCVYSWWRAVHGPLPPSQWDEYGRRVTTGLNAADVVVAPSNAMARALRACYDLRRAATVIPNGRAASPFAPAEKRNVIMAAGRVWDEAKNLRTLMDAAPRLSWPVRIAGPDTAPDGTRIAAPSVDMLGRLSGHDLADALGNTAVFVHPALYEPFGLGVVEAALCGCALVLSDIASLRENWDRAALFVPPRDTDALVAAIEYLIAFDDERNTLARRARDRALLFAPERMARAYMDLYNRLAPRRTTRLACAS